MKFVLGLLIGIALGWCIWHFAVQNHSPNPTVQNVQNRLESAADKTRETIQTNWKNLNTDEIKEELARTGRVVRDKVQSAGKLVADATADARITAAIKGKIIANPHLSVWNISVNTTAGRVTLSGTVSSPDNIREAMELALNTDGVQGVVSTLQVKS